MIRVRRAAGTAVALRLALPGALAWATLAPSTCAAARGPAVERQEACGLPAWALGTGIVTTVELRVQVGRDGRARRVTVEPYTVRDDMLTRRLRASFDSAAVACVRRWSYRPAHRDGRPVTAWLRVGVTFEDPGREAEPSAPGRDTLAKARR